MRASRFLALSLLVLALSVKVSRAHAEPMRDFVLSCSYGVLAGTLVGAATLAFSDRPGDNLNKVARGASFGLYGGILLGLYVVYGVNDKATEEEVRNLGLNAPRFFVQPVLADSGSLAGAEVRYDLLRF